jgi:hypothetical protein
MPDKIDPELEAARIARLNSKMNPTRVVSKLEAVLKEKGPELVSGEGTVSDPYKGFIFGDGRPKVGYQVKFKSGGLVKPRGVGKASRGFGKAMNK